MIKQLHWGPSCLERAGLPCESFMQAWSTVCPHCHELGVDYFHQFWGCPSLEHSQWPKVSATNHLAPKVAAEVLYLPCLWLRGLFHADLCLGAGTPPLDVHSIQIYDPFAISPDPDVWPQGLYGTDAFGGEFGGYPTLGDAGVACLGLSPLTSLYSLNGVSPSL